LVIPAPKSCANALRLLSAQTENENARVRAGPRLLERASARHPTNEGNGPAMYPGGLHEREIVIGSSAFHELLKGRAS